MNKEFHSFMCKSVNQIFAVCDKEIMLSIMISCEEVSAGILNVRFLAIRFPLTPAKKLRLYFSLLADQCQAILRAIFEIFR